MDEGGWRVGEGVGFEGGDSCKGGVLGVVYGGLVGGCWVDVGVGVVEGGGFWWVGVEVDKGLDGE